jgi:hypothetical protein
VLALDDDHVRWFDRNGRPQTPAEASVTGVLRRAWRQRGRAAVIGQGMVWPPGTIVMAVDDVDDEPPDAPHCAVGTPVSGSTGAE